MQVSLSINFKKTRTFPSSSDLRTSPSSNGVYGSKVKKRNKHQYMNSCHLISHHWSNTINGLHRHSVAQRSVHMPSYKVWFLMVSIRN